MLRFNRRAIFYQNIFGDRRSVTNNTESFGLNLDTVSESGKMLVQKHLKKRTSDIRCRNKSAEIGDISTVHVVVSPVIGGETPWPPPPPKKPSRKKNLPVKCEIKLVQNLLKKKRKML